MREIDEVSLMKLEGYAATFGPYPVHGGPDEGGWMEEIDPAAAAEAVAANPRVPLRIGLDGPVVGTADLSVDENGIRMEATINVGHEFRVRDQRWTDEYVARRITALAFDSMDISIAPKGPDE